ncbi:GNAT family protein [Streptomyces sp. MP131-18]|uniref:GNAT family N-acetyltransferase n=1 Tax=Streptomyces sp. MP131-18 TaxID=1857892 RepID=UPI0009A24FFD|nr:GNAT family protein [Streptomyces sp. MP131-18]
MSQSLVNLRKLTLNDWQAVHSWASLEEACRYQPRGPNSEDQTRAFVQTAAEAWSRARQQRFVCIARSENNPVGMDELHIRSHRHRQGEITCIVHPRAWGRGVGTAIGRELLSRGFRELGLHRIYATCDPRNLPSARVLGKPGMTYEGRHRHTALIRDGWRDSEMFSVLEAERRPSPGARM